MGVIKLKDLLLEKNIVKLRKEAAPMDVPKITVPNVAHQLTPPAHIAYVDPAGDKNRKGMEPYTQKGIDFTGLGTSNDFQITNEFVEYLKSVENGIKKGFWNGIWKPIPAPENPKSLDIGYGHKIKKGENFSKGITDAQAVSLLKKDIEDAKRKVDRYLKQNNMPSNLTQQQWEMLIDYAFNLKDIATFPKMIEAVVRGDLVTARKEYKRFATIDGRKQEIGRNKEFYNRYLANAKSPIWRGRVA